MTFWDEKHGLKEGSHPKVSWQMELRRHPGLRAAAACFPHPPSPGGPGKPSAASGQVQVDAAESGKGPLLEVPFS